MKEVNYLKAAEDTIKLIQIYNYKKAIVSSIYSSLSSLICNIQVLLLFPCKDASIDPDPLFLPSPSHCIDLDLYTIISTLLYPTFQIIGHDWGGVVAWRVGITYPQYVEKLIVANTAGPSSDEVCTSLSFL